MARDNEITKKKEEIFRVFDWIQTPPSLPSLTPAYPSLEEAY